MIVAGHPGRAMRIFGGVLLLLALSGWSAWFVICNVYGFAPPLDPWALTCGWLIGMLAVVQGWRGHPARRDWCLCGLAASIGLYLLLIHRGVGPGVASLALLAASASVLVAARRDGAVVPAEWQRQTAQNREKAPAATAGTGDTQPER